MITVGFLIFVMPAFFILGAMLFLKYRKVRSKEISLGKSLFRTLNIFSPFDDSIPLKEDMWLIKLVVVVVLLWGLAIFILGKVFNS